MTNSKWSIIVLLLAAIAVFAQVDDDYATRKASMGDFGHTRAIIGAQNDTIKVQLDDTDGQFVIGKTVGNIRLLYGFPSSPWSSWTCFYIDGTHYSSDFGAGSDPSGSVQLGGGTVAHPFTLVPHSGDSSYLYGGWTQSGLDIHQTLMPVYVWHSPDSDAFIFIKYEIVNTSASSHTVGVILQMDTQINTNDAAPLGTSVGYSATQTEWVGDTIPPWWFAWETTPPVPPGYITGMGIIDGFDAVRPDRFAVGSWPTFNPNGTWTFHPGGGPYGDSSVLYWWGIDTLAPGDTMITATYYGVGHPFVSGSFLFNVEPISVVNCNYIPNPFEFSTFFTNESGLLMDSVVIHLDLPDGIVIAIGNEDTMMTGGDHLSSFGTAVMSWELAIISTPTSDTIHVWTTNESTSDTFHGYYILEVPAVGMPPQAALIDPANASWTSCEAQEISLYFTSENGLLLDSDLTFEIDGGYIDLSDPRLTRIGDTLRFVPSVPWDDGAMIVWGLMEAVDAMGCSLEAAVSGYFEVDISPPVAENEWPEDGDVLGYTEIPGIWVELYDEIREVDESTITVIVNEDTFTLTDTELTYTNDSLFFDYIAAGMVFEDGDTVCLSIEGVTDIEPDYCGVNEMATFDWCFSFQIIDLWLPDTQLCPPGETFLIPVYTENLSGIGVTDMEISIELNEDILEPVGVETAGAVTSTWTLGSSITGNIITVDGSGPELMGGGVLFYLEVFVPVEGTEAAFSPLEFVTATFNSGLLSAKPVDGFVTICFTEHIWTNDVIFYVDDQNRKVLTLGGITGATDMYNAGLDIQWLPSPAGKIDAWFDIDDPVFPVLEKLIRDFRAPGPLPIIWTGTAGRIGTDTVHVRWIPAHFPDGRFTLRYTDDGVDYAFDMHNTNRAKFTEEVDFSITYEQPEIGRTEMVVCPGWNLISFPFVPNEGVKISDAIGNSLTPGYWFDPEMAGYVITETPEPGKGYWVFCTDHDTFEVAGMLVQATELPVSYGWNMFGVPWEISGVIPVGALELTPDVLIGGNIFGYDACGTGGYISELTELEVGQGYWLLANGSAELYIQGDTCVSRVAPVREAEFIFNFELDSKPRTVGLDPSSLAGLDEFDRAIPPPNPDGGEVFGLIAEDYILYRDIKPGEKAEFILEASGKLMTWNPDAIPDNIELTLVNGGAWMPMKDFDRAILTGSAKVIAERILPDKMVLYNASPNPFNPVTEIKFAIPEPAVIDLSVHDLLGRKIATLVSGEFGTGIHRVSWNGRDASGVEMPTGVYFYRIVTADGESITKSMVLLK